MGLQVFPALPHAPIDTHVRDADHYAGYDEAQNEKEFLWTGAILFENCARERGGF